MNSELYDPATNQFIPTGSLTIGRKGHQTTILTSGKVLVTSGDPGDYTSIAAVELYDIGDGILPTNLFPGVDTVAPSVPANPSATAASSTSITVTWTASTDNVGGTGVQGYYIYRTLTKINHQFIIENLFLFFFGEVMEHGDTTIKVNRKIPVHILADTDCSLLSV